MRVYYLENQTFLYQVIEFPPGRSSTWAEGRTLPGKKFGGFYVDVDKKTTLGGQWHWNKAFLAKLQIQQIYFGEFSDFVGGSSWNLLRYTHMVERS